MRQPVIDNLEQISISHAQLAQDLINVNIDKENERFKALSKEYADLEPIVSSYSRYKGLVNELQESKTLLKDKEMAEVAKEEVQRLDTEIEALTQEIYLLLIPKDENDKGNIFVEIRAGTGGEESGLFAGDLFRMYSRYSDLKGFQLEVYDQKESEKGGYKEIVAKITGNGVYGRLKYEAGTHRVQRVPKTESQGRIHTSASTVAILPINDKIESIDVNKADLRIDTFRASGAGGQHINKTDSAIRITHIPSGVVVECQDERSQHKNRAKAMALLQAKLTFLEQEKQQKEASHQRKMMVGSGDRSEKIRTYNFPQGRITDHRINLTLYKLSSVMEGELDELIDSLITEDNAEKLVSFNT